MSGPVRKSMVEVVAILAQVRDDGSTLPPGYSLGWEVPGNADADEELKVLGSHYREQGERRYLDDPVGGITAILGRHAEREARKEAQVASRKRVIDEVIATVESKGGDPKLLDPDTVRLLLDEPIEEEETSSPVITISRISERSGSRGVGVLEEIEVPRLTRGEVERIKEKASAQEVQILTTARTQHDVRMNLRRGVVEREISDLHRHTPKPQKGGGSMHVYLELTHQQPTSEIDGVPVLPLRPDREGKLTTIAHLRWVVGRWVEYDAIDSLPEVQAVIAGMVEELGAKIGGPPGTKTLPPASRADVRSMAVARGARQ